MEDLRDSSYDRNVIFLSVSFEITHGCALLALAIAGAGESCQTPTLIIAVALVLAHCGVKPMPVGRCDVSQTRRFKCVPNLVGQMVRSYNRRKELSRAWAGAAP